MKKNEKKGARPNGRAPFFPMQPHCESLNAAIAAAIVMWQMKNGEYGG